MSDFIKLHKRIPNFEVKYISNRIGCIREQKGFKDYAGEEIYFNVSRIEYFTDYNVNNIDVFENSEEILKELEK